MQHWTPDQISNLIEKIVQLAGAIGAVIYALRQSSNSVPKETVHKIIDQQNLPTPTVTAQFTPTIPPDFITGTTVVVPPSSDIDKG